MLDFIERLEAGADAAHSEATKGLPKGKWRCGCGRIADEDDMHTLSPNPYASPGCGVCLDGFLDENNKEIAT